MRCCARRSAALRVEPSFTVSIKDGCRYRKEGSEVNQIVANLIKSLDAHPEEWSATGYELQHPKATIWIANNSYGIHAETEFGHWGGVVLFALPGSARWRLWRAVKRWRASRLEAAFA